MKRFTATDADFRRALIAITIIALLLRLGFCMMLGFSRPPDGTTAWADQNFFENLAWGLAQGHGFLTPEGIPTAYQAPGYPFILAALYKVFGHHYALNSLLQSLLGALACLGIGLLARRLGLRRGVALLAASIAAVLPTGLVAASSFTTEAPAQFFTVFTSLLIATAIQERHSPKGYRCLLFAGLLCGYGALVRAQMLALPLFLGVLLILSRQLSFRRSVGWAVSFGLAAALVIAPWTIRNWIVLGGFCPVVSSGGLTYLSAYNPYTLNPKDERFGYTELGGVVATARAAEVLTEPDELKRDKLDFALGTRYKAMYPVNPLRLAAARMYRLLKFTTTATNRAQRLGYFVDSLLLVPWFLLGLVVVLAFSASRWRFIPVYVHVLTLLVVTLRYFGYLRYRASYGPVLALLSAIFFVWMIAVMRVGFRRAGDTLFDPDGMPA